MADKKPGKFSHKFGRGRKALLKAAADFEKELKEIEIGVWWLEPKPLPARRVHSKDIQYMLSDVGEPGLSSYQKEIGTYIPKTGPVVYRSIKPGQTRLGDRDGE